MLQRMKQKGFYQYINDCEGSKIYSIWLHKGTQILNS